MKVEIRGRQKQSLSKVGVVLQTIVPESPRFDGLVFQKLGCSKKLSQNGVVFQKLEWCSKKLSQNPHSVYYYSGKIDHPRWLPNVPMYNKT